MHKIKYIIAAGLLFIFFGCENSKIVDVPLQFEEDVVVQAQIYADTLFQGVRISRTVPINKTYDIKTAQIKDAIAYLRINGIQIVPLHYVANGIYMPAGNLAVMSGDNYELFGAAGGTKFYSQTIIPKTPDVSNIGYNEMGKYMEASVKANTGEVYGAVWNISRIDYLTASNFYSIVSPSGDQTNTSTRTDVLPEIYQSVYYDGRRYIQVFAFDQQFKPFFYSKDANQPIENYFVQSGGSIAWNVYGDHVIGLFIGIAKSRL